MASKSPMSWFLGMTQFPQFHAHSQSMQARIHTYIHTYIHIYTYTNTPLVDTRERSFTAMKCTRLKIHLFACNMQCNFQRKFVFSFREASPTSFTVVRRAILDSEKRLAKSDLIQSNTHANPPHFLMRTDTGRLFPRVDATILNAKGRIAPLRPLPTRNLAGNPRGAPLLPIEPSPVVQARQSPEPRKEVTRCSCRQGGEGDSESVEGCGPQEEEVEALVFAGAAVHCRNGGRRLEGCSMGGQET